MEPIAYVAGWRLRAWYHTLGTKLETYDSRMPLFLHPRFSTLMPVTGAFPYDEEKMLAKARAALYWVLHGKENTRGLAGVGGGKIKRRPDDHVRVTVEVEFVTETRVGTITCTDVLDNPPSEVELQMMGLAPLTTVK